MDYDVVVIGAGPSGLRTAQLIAQKKFNVLVLEEHEEVGKPLKCAGLVSWRLLELLPNLPNEIIVNTVNKAKFFSSFGSSFVLESKKPVYVIDRPKLDKFLANEAKKSGAEIKTSTQFKKFRYFDELIELETSKGKFKTKILVGADGANSKLVQLLGIKQPKNVLTGIQATVEGNFDSNSVELWFGSSIAPDFFAWLIPLSKRKARIGLATKTKSKYYFEKFLEKRIGKKKQADVAGTIRFGLMDTVADRILLVGDAACMVKPLSGGGIIYGLIGAKYCADACIKALSKNKFDYEFLKKEYDEKWKEKLEKSIKKGLLYRKILNKLSDKQLDLFFSSGKMLGLTKILETFDMDLL
jgi:geranylgeranyl reductase family protein